MMKRCVMKRNLRHDNHEVDPVDIQEHGAWIHLDFEKGRVSVMASLVARRSLNLCVLATHHLANDIDNAGDLHIGIVVRPFPMPCALCPCHDGSDVNTRRLPSACKVASSKPYLRETWVDTALPQ